MDNMQNQIDFYQQLLAIIFEDEFTDDIVSLGQTYGFDADASIQLIHDMIEDKIQQIKDCMEADMGPSTES